MNLPNKLTMLRVIMVPFFMVFAAMSHYGSAGFNATYSLIAGVLFAAASFTDFLDGYLARKNHLVTDFGKFMDPLADKMLTTAAIIYMVVDGVCSPVVLAIIMFREFAVAGVRMIAAESGTVIAANIWGKVKTVLQMLTIIFYYFAAALAGPTNVMVVSLITQVLCWAVAAVTALSGAIYLWQNRACFMQAK
ncbi:CDP-diacylglycerol--glycerol-3-phosphate 3-phosphatidyltransferase [bacterium]|uniref:CDP-diacylglycerol--glycerol-3-phosphate 3-phosphatidyltransferase n=1 Tax=Gemmiger sp. TaxID=2049027 RepID=UPI002A90BE4A|nr:CDP-diacylglycerol--glycerol-3-phosphate 3-phosphatidyltransferase [Gemmiger sp.]MCI5555951.1 CDP-diacylglycerol--glycerol-3-phosphate 3-phosphatidyltransferase [bacterium]MCI6083652.1 CDP-diacylglycerol--glycerol-3-phosphate 3-phosphatidyltransferase [bacterium]MCI6248636.1 CDP-diacylglycerol--glycerol-3-phosphate 3-phosphatidyltransferase [bacterium]MCI6520453.1 CDP-diacylglycerol--glycerol-3-phosphate 3-phosphatidyltransferase [bacterium]MCI6884725.1 CDP-diacylglycerol--glycerol-3-phosph